jgi:ABC-type multidrug transport system ATPase subunit
VVKIFDAVRELNREGMTVLLVEQNARQVLKLAHRGSVPENGRIVMTDAAAKLAESDEVRKPTSAWPESRRLLAGPSPYSTTNCASQVGSIMYSSSSPDSIVIV